MTIYEKIKSCSRWKGNLIKGSCVTVVLGDDGSQIREEKEDNDEKDDAETHMHWSSIT